MIRWVGAAVVALGLSLGACSHETKKDNNGPAFVAAPDGEAIVGTWSDGANTFTFDANLNYRWEKEIPCGKPPCATSATSGSYQLRSGKVYLNPPQGNDVVIDLSWADQQKTVTLHSGADNATWTLHKR